MSDEPMRSRKPPEWAAGLRQLYDSVVEEPLPDTFEDLLSRFDDTTEVSNDGQSPNPAPKTPAPKGKGA